MFFAIKRVHSIMKTIHGASLYRARNKGISTTQENYREKTLHYIGVLMVFFLGTFINAIAYADNLAFIVQLDSGQITHIYQQRSDMVFSIDSAQGVI